MIVGLWFLIHPHTTMERKEAELDGKWTLVVGWNDQTQYKYFWVGGDFWGGKRLIELNNEQDAAELKDQLIETCDAFLDTR